MSQYVDLNIVLIDDDEVDVMIITNAFESYGFLNPIYVASDGVEALEMLRGEGDREKIPQPYLILLDLNMPRMNGLEFLEELRGDEDLRDSIVFMLTTSEDDQDRTEAYSQYIAGYIVKSETGENFINLIKLIENLKMVIRFPQK